MKKYENVLAGRLMAMAADSFSNHGCNDLEPSLFEGVDAVQRIALEFEWNLWNCPSGEDYIPLAHVGDYGLMAFFADRLEDDGE